MVLTTTVDDDLTTLVDVDNTIPVISSVTITAGGYKVLSAISITVDADESGYTAGTINVNSVATTGFADNTDTTYGVTYTVVEADFKGVLTMISSCLIKLFSPLRFILRWSVSTSFTI